MKDRQFLKLSFFVYWFCFVCFVCALECIYDVRFAMVLELPEPCQVLMNFLGWHMKRKTQRLRVHITIKCANEIKEKGKKKAEISSMVKHLECITSMLIKVARQKQDREWWVHFFSIFWMCVVEHMFEILLDCIKCRLMHFEIGLSAPQLNTHTHIHIHFVSNSSSTLHLFNFIKSSWAKGNCQKNGSHSLYLVSLNCIVNSNWKLDVCRKVQWKSMDQKSSGLELLKLHFYRSEMNQAVIKYKCSEREEKRWRERKKETDEARKREGAKEILRPMVFDSNDIRLKFVRVLQFQ